MSTEIKRNVQFVQRLVKLEDRGMLSYEVEQVMKDRQWSLAQAQIATGVNRGTIHNMRLGLGAGRDQVLKFANAVAPDGQVEEVVRRFLVAAATDKARDVISDYAVQKDEIAVVILDDELRASMGVTPVVHEEPDFNSITIEVEGLAELDWDSRTLARRLAESVIGGVIESQKIAFRVHESEQNANDEATAEEVESPKSKSTSRKRLSSQR